jgi:hypothetical protein
VTLYRQKPLFSTKPPRITARGLTGNPSAPKGRQWLRSFLVPEQCPPEELPTIKHSSRKEATRK